MHIVDDFIRVGDIVRKRNGKKHIEVTFVSDNNHHYYQLIGKYVESGAAVQSRYKNGFVKIGNEEVKGEIGMRGKLFKVKADGRFGEGLTTDKEDNYVLQMKDASNKIEVFKENELEMIVPFTFAVKYSGGSEKNYRGKEGVLAVGDYVIEHVNGKFNFGVVSKVNTKVDTTAKFKGRKILTERVVFETDETQ